MSLQINGISIADTDYLKVAVGTTNERPVTIVEGMLRFNTTDEKVELASFSEISTTVILWKQLPFSDPIPDTLSFALQQDTGTSPTDNITSNGAVVVSGINVINGYWQYSTDSGVSWTTKATDTNSFILNNGTYPINKVQVRQVNSVGFSSIPATNLTEIVVDGTPPIISINTISVDNVLISNEDPDVTQITGVVTAGSTVKLTFNTITRDASVTDTTWRYTVVLADLTALGNGSGKVITATGTDTAGNTSTASRTVTVGTSPSNLSLALQQDTGTSTSDNITKNGTIVVSGINVGSTGYWQYRVNGGSWTRVEYNVTSFTLNEGTYNSGSIEVRQVNESGYSSIPVSNTSTINVDTTSPTITMNIISSDGILVDNVDPGVTQITGTVTDANIDAVKLTFGATVKTATISGTTWTYSVVLADLTALGYGTSKTITATATDKPGNTASTATRTVTVIQAPSQLTSIILSQDTGTSTTDKITKNGTMTVGGIAATASKWQYSIDGGTNWTDQLTSTNSFVLDEGIYEVGKIKARQFSEDGIYPSTPISYGSRVEVDTTAPGVTIDVISGDDIITGITTITGTVESGRTVTLTLKATTRTNVTVTGTTWSYALTSTDIGSSVLGTGVNIPITATTSADPAGNIGTVTRYVTNTTVPAALTLTLASDTGSSNSDRITNNGTMNVSGITVASPGYWQYSTDNGGNWSGQQSTTVTSFALSEGTYTANKIQVRQINAQGISSVITQFTSEITVDKTAPIVTMNTISGDNTILSSDAGTSITGTVSDEATTVTVQIKFGATAGTNTLSVTGNNWTYTIASADLTNLGVGTGKVITATATDKAGNTATATQTVTNTSKPTALTLTLASDTGSSATDKITNNGTMNVSGINVASPGYWQYSTDNGQNWSGSQLTTVTSFALNEGSYSANYIQVRQINAQGISSDITTYTSAIVLDKTVPTVTMNTISVDNVLLGTADIGTEITGTVNDANFEKIELKFGSTAGVNNNIISITGTTWTYTIASADLTALGVGTGKVITATATDKAGNTATATQTVTNTSKPSKLSLALASDTGTSASDWYTNNGTINVSGINVGSTGNWQYSINNGQNWTNIAYNITTFTLNAGYYAANDVQVKQTNAQGYSSDITYAPAITIDKTAPSITMNVISSDDALTYADMDVTSITGTVESGHTVSLSLNGTARTPTVSGTSWSYLVTEADFTVLGEGSGRVITASTSADQAGNVGSVSRTVTVTTWGSIIFTSAGTRTWTPPHPKIRTVHVVAIGGGSSGVGAYNAINVSKYPGSAVHAGAGGGVGYRNNISVSSSNTYTVVVGAGGAAPITPSSGSVYGGAGSGSSFSNGSTVYASGNGATRAYSGTITSDGTYSGAVGGYSGTGGSYTGEAGGSGANGKSSGTTNIVYGGNAGNYTGDTAGQTSTGTSLYGSTVAGGTPGATVSTGAGNEPQWLEPTGGLYGAGGQTRLFNSKGGDGATGAVRIVWGVGRSFPSTNVSTATNETSG